MTGQHDGADPSLAAPDEVDRHAPEFFDGVRRVVADRFAEARYDPDLGLRVTVINLEDHDIEQITHLAECLGIAEWVRIERADPATLESWEQLRHELLRLCAIAPDVLDEYPMPQLGYRRPPVRVGLAADAEAAAAGLHQRYGNFLRLRVGALPYPPEPLANRPPPLDVPATPPTEAMNPEELRVALDGPVIVSRGQTIRQAVLLSNLSGDDVQVCTNGYLTATIIDNAGQPVGGYASGHTQVLRIFTAKPGETVRLPLLVGTAGYTPEIGYTIPAGTWHLTAVLDLSDGRRIRTPAFDLTITTT